MTTRRWMIAVTVVGSVLGMAEMIREGGRLRERAAFHAREERQAIDVLARPGVLKEAAANMVHERHRSGFGGARFEETNNLFDEMLAYWQRLADYHGAMRRKYARAARNPWFRVEPEPPTGDEFPRA
jgi:hypothetical protein